MYNDDRQMYDVNLDCAKCGAKITQLPFQPSGDRPVYCSDCNRAYREERRNSRPPRQMYTVDLTCAGCGAKITQLPFQPKEGSDIFCKECYLKNRNA